MGDEILEKQLFAFELSSTSRGFIQLPLDNFVNVVSFSSTRYLSAKNIID